MPVFWAAAFVFGGSNGVVDAVDFSTVPGTVIDWSPASSGIYVGTPSIVVMPDGTLVASHDEFGPGSTSPTDAVTHVFQSTDQGVTWKESYTIDNGDSSTACGAEWSGLFVEGGDLYMMGVSKDYGNIVIRESTDDGTTWTVPTNASNGVLTATAGYHTSAQPVIEQDGRVWRAFENINGGTAWPNWFESFVMSAPIGADLTQASSWTMSNALSKPTSWTAASGNNGWLEGGLVSGPTGLENILRIDTDGPQRAAEVTVNSPSSVSFDPTSDVVSFPGGATKFTVQYDESTGRYYALTNPVQPGVSTTTPSDYRNTLALISSTDLTNWQVDSVVLYNADATTHAFQYVDWQFDGNDIVAATRTAFDDGEGGANSYHNANLLTFNRVANYAAQQPDFTLIADSGDATHASKVVMMQTVAGAGTQGMYNAQTFATGIYAGQPLTDAFGIAQDLKGQIYIGEEKDGGRILRFDRSGDFLGVVATEGVNFTGRPETIIRGPDGMLYMSVAFGTDSSDKIYRFDPSTNVTGMLTPFIPTTGTGPGGTYTLSDPRGIAFDSAGNFYVGDRNNDTIREFNSAGVFEKNLATFTQPVQSLSFDAANNRLLVSLGSSMVIDAVSLTGTVSPVLTLGANTVLDVEDIGGSLFYTDYSSSPPSVRRVDSATSDSVQTTASDLDIPGHMLAIGSNSATWTGSVDTSMSKAGNWGLTVAPDFTGWETFNFGSAGATTINNDVTGAILGGLIIQSSAGPHTFTGNGFTMKDGAAIINNSTSVLTLNTGSITLNSMPIGAVGGDVVINSPVTMSTGATVTIRGSFTVTLNGIVSGAGTLDALEGTTVITNNSNNFTGSTMIDGGVVLISAGHALGASGSSTSIVGDGATGCLELTGGISVAEPLTLDARQYAGASAPQILNVSGNNTLSGTITGTSSGGGTAWNVESDTGTLTLAGSWINNATTGTQTLNLMGSGNGTVQTSIPNGASAATALTKSGAGTWTISAANTFTGNATVSGGVLNVTGSLASMNVLVSAGATLDAISMSSLPSTVLLTANGTVTFAANPNSSGPAARTLASISIGNTGEVSLTNAASHANRTVLVTSGLSFAGSTNGWQGHLDLAGNDLIVHNGNLATITNQIKTGRSTTGSASWMGPGIDSSTAQTDLHAITGLGVIINNDGTGKAVTASFDNQTVGVTDILVKYTYVGDANLDGEVDGSDYTKIDNGFHNHLTGWGNGDFNYDNVVDGSDYTLIDNAFNTQGASLTTQISDLVTIPTAMVVGGSVVPEPTAMGMIGLGAGGLLVRRRRRQTWPRDLGGTT